MFDYNQAKTTHTHTYSLALFVMQYLLNKQNIYKYLLTDQVSILVFVCK